jgi:hypothetical protein
MPAMPDAPKYKVVVPPYGQVPALCGFGADPNSIFSKLEMRQALVAQATGSSAPFKTTLSFYANSQATIDENVVLQGFLNLEGFDVTLNPRSINFILIFMVYHIIVTIIQCGTFNLSRNIISGVS